MLGHGLVRWSRRGTSFWWRCLSVWVGAPSTFKAALEGNNHPPVCLGPSSSSTNAHVGCAQGWIAGEAVGSHQHTHRSDGAQEFSAGAAGAGALGMMLMYIFSGLNRLRFLKDLGSESIPWSTLGEAFLIVWLVRWKKPNWRRCG